MNATPPDLAQLRAELAAARDTVRACTGGPGRPSHAQTITTLQSQVAALTAEPHQDAGRATDTPAPPPLHLALHATKLLACASTAEMLRELHGILLETHCRDRQGHGEAGRAAAYVNDLAAAVEERESAPAAVMAHVPAPELGDVIGGMVLNDAGWLTGACTFGTIVEILDPGRGEYLIRDRNKARRRRIAFTHYCQICRHCKEPVARSTSLPERWLHTTRLVFACPKGITVASPAPLKSDVRVDRHPD